ncbi:MAG: primosomal protein N' [Clostridiaceae bacterium]|jgi:primosomal protein N' (replication factor Y)|nr:primosomal protein N' [Clostridiaceae bacterium]
MHCVAKVAVAAAVISIDKPYDYLAPPELADQAQPGRRVMAPFGRGDKLTEGFIVEIRWQEEISPRIKPLNHIFGPTVMLDAEQLELADIIRKRYFCTFFEAANLMTPPGVWSRKTYYRLGDGLTLEQAQARCSQDWDSQAVCQLIAARQGPVEEEELKKSFSAKVLKKCCKELLETHTIEKTVRFTAAKDQTIRILRLKKPLEEALASLRKNNGYEKRAEALRCIADYDGIPEKEVCYLTGASASSVRTLIRSGLVDCAEQQTFRRVAAGPTELAPPILLEEEQRQAYEGILAMEPPAAALLQGVTGSGKTEVYIRLAQAALEAGRSAIVLTPEISLTPQLLRRFCGYFPDQVAVFHSGLTAGQRYDEYKRVKSGQARVALGARSAVFAPLQNIGLIIVDEEQEWTYKSDSAPRYHTREIAKYRCVRHKARLVLGSATPAVESRFQAEQGKYGFFPITRRYQNTPLPRVIVADMRSRLRQGEPDCVAPELAAELERNLEKGEQSVLFLNRRGASRMATCVACGHVPQCQNCSAALTYHSRNNRLMCHYCGYSQPMPEKCPQCGEPLRMVGFGTQRVQQRLEEKFPGIQIIRMDADTTTQRVSHEKLLEAFRAGQAQILLGTQMIAKGLDFENVTLAGVLDADLSLYSGDFRAGERTFSLLTQAVGRSGRRDKAGRAVIQTYTPENRVIQAAASQDYEAFYRYEIEMRQALMAPPFQDLFSFLVSGENQNQAEQAALRLAATLRQWFEGPFQDIAAPVLGPAPPPIWQLNRRYRYQVSFRGRETPRSRQLAEALLRAFYNESVSRGVSLIADINPYSL